MRKNGDHVVGKGRMVDSLCLFVYVHEYIPRKLMNFPPTVHKPSNSSDFKPLTFYWRNFPQKTYTNIGIHQIIEKTSEKYNTSDWKFDPNLYITKSARQHTHFDLSSYNILENLSFMLPGFTRIRHAKFRNSKILIVTFWRTNDW